MAQKLSILSDCPLTPISTSCLVVITRSVFHVPASLIWPSCVSAISSRAANAAVEYLYSWQELTEFNVKLRNAEVGLQKLRQFGKKTIFKENYNRYG